MEKVAANRLKPSSFAEYQKLLDGHINPALGWRKLSQVAKADVAKFHADRSHISTTANRGLALISVLYATASAWGLVPDGQNPAKGVRRYTENKRTRFLSREEVQRLGTALAQREVRSPGAILAIRLLALTGMRRMEVVCLRWEHVDIERGEVRLPDSKTGARPVPLGQAAVQLLEQAPRVGAWVCPSILDPRRHVADVNDIWGKLREEANLQDARLHDLRHLYGSTSVTQGFSLPITAAILGHASTHMTERYAHLQDSPVRAAADAVSEEIAGMLGGRQAARVINLAERR